MKYIHTYATQNDYDLDDGKGYPNVGYVEGDDVVIYHMEVPSHDYSKDYLTFEALENGTFSFTSGCSYSLNSGSTWRSLAANTSTPRVLAGEKIMFKGNITPGSRGIGIFSSTGRFNAMGNPLSLNDSDHFADITSFSRSNMFRQLFSGCTTLVSAQNLSLPVTQLNSNCYRDMFNGCTSLTKAPELLATRLSLYCYYQMFSGCTSLNYIKMLATDTSSTSCLQNWVFGVSATGTFVKNASMTSLPSGASGIPTGWTVIDA